MPRQPSCQYCRWFHLLRDGAVIGQCHNDSGEHSFPRKEACCPQFDVERRIEERDEAEHDSPATIEFDLPTRRY